MCLLVLICVQFYHWVGKIAQINYTISTTNLQKRSTRTPVVRITKLLRN